MMRRGAGLRSNCSSRGLSTGAEAVGCIGTFLAEWREAARGVFAGAAGSSSAAANLSSSFPETVAIGRRLARAALHLPWLFLLSAIRSFGEALFGLWAALCAAFSEVVAQLCPRRRDAVLGCADLWRAAFNSICWETTDRALERNVDRAAGVAAAASAAGTTGVCAGRASRFAGGGGGGVQQLPFPVTGGAASGVGCLLSAAWLLPSHPLNRLALFGRCAGGCVGLVCCECSACLGAGLLASPHGAPETEGDSRRAWSFFGRRLRATPETQRDAAEGTSRDARNTAETPSAAAPWFERPLLMAAFVHPEMQAAAAGFQESLRLAAAPRPSGKGAGGVQQQPPSACAERAAPPSVLGCFFGLAALVGSLPPEASASSVRSPAATLQLLCWHSLRLLNGCVFDFQLMSLVSAALREQCGLAVEGSHRSLLQQSLRAPPAALPGSLAERDGGSCLSNKRSRQGGAGSSASCASASFFSGSPAASGGGSDACWEGGPFFGGGNHAACAFCSANFVLDVQPPPPQAVLGFGPRRDFSFFFLEPLERCTCTAPLASGSACAVKSGASLTLKRDRLSGASTRTAVAATDAASGNAGNNNSSNNSSGSWGFSALLTQALLPVHMHCAHCILGLRSAEAAERGGASLVNEAFARSLAALGSPVEGGGPEAEGLVAASALCASWPRLFVFRPTRVYFEAAAAAGVRAASPGEGLWLRVGGARAAEPSAADLRALLSVLSRARSLLLRRAERFAHLRQPSAASESQSFRQTEADAESEGLVSLDLLAGGGANFQLRKTQTPSSDAESSAAEREGAVPSLLSAVCARMQTGERSLVDLAVAVRASLSLAEGLLRRSQEGSLVLTRRQQRFFEEMLRDFKTWADEFGGSAAAQ